MVDDRDVALVASQTHVGAAAARSELEKRGDLVSAAVACADMTDRRTWDQKLMRRCAASKPAAHGLMELRLFRLSTGRVMVTVAPGRLVAPDMRGHSCTPPSGAPDGYMYATDPRALLADDCAVFEVSLLALLCAPFAASLTKILRWG